MKVLPTQNPDHNKEYNKLKEQEHTKEDSRANPPLGGHIDLTYRTGIEKDPKKESTPTQERAIPNK